MNRGKFNTRLPSTNNHPQLGAAGELRDCPNIVLQTVWSQNLTVPDFGKPKLEALENRLIQTLYPV
eukprot:380636-Pelagomonas_calceolata.AAC.16